MPVSIAMALSGIERDQWGDFKQLFDQGAKVMSLSTPPPSMYSSRSSSRASSRAPSPSTVSTESGIASLSPEPKELNKSLPHTLRDYCLFKIEAMKCGDIEALEIIEIFDEAGKAKKQSKEPNPVYTKELNWFGRNLLNLEDNLRGNATMYVPAELPHGVKGYFENRSQISRMQGAPAPDHEIQGCPVCTCKFQEPVFY